jgi:hypothetical protein
VSIPKQRSAVVGAKVRGALHFVYLQRAAGGHCARRCLHRCVVLIHLPYTKEAELIAPSWHLS